MKVHILLSLWFGGHSGHYALNRYENLLEIKKVECLRIKFLIMNQTNRGKNCFLHVRMSPKQIFKQKLCMYLKKKKKIHTYFFGKTSFLLGLSNPAHCFDRFFKCPKHVKKLVFYANLKERTPSIFREVHGIVPPLVVPMVCA